MVTPRNKKSIRKPRHVLIDPEALYKARVEVLPAATGLLVSEKVALLYSCFYYKAILKISQINAPFFFISTSLFSQAGAGGCRHRA